MINIFFLLVVIFNLISCENPEQLEPKKPITIDFNDNDSINIDPDPAWLVSAKERIEQYRKANLEICVFNDDGSPISNAEVKVKMTRHAFGFGALMGQARWEDKPNPEDASRCRELVENYFNKVVVGADKNMVGDIQLNWMKERDIKVRGHYLMWARIQIEDENRSGQPDKMPDDVDELREIALQYIKEMVTWAGDRISEWDAINHIVTDVSGHLGYDHLFGPAFFADVIKYAREHASPGVEMWVNEGSILTGDGSRQDKYIEQIRKLIEYGGKPDGVGFMSHFKNESDLISMEEIFKRLDRFAKLVPNLQLTEFDIDVSDQKLHAEYLRDVMTIAFSHPAVSGIVMWQVWGGSENNTTLWNPDWTIKPAGEAWLDLVFNEWWTDQSGKTTNDGKFDLRGFIGNYEISVQVGNEFKSQQCNLQSRGEVLNFVF